MDRTREFEQAVKERSGGEDRNEEGGRQEKRSGEVKSVVVSKSLRILKAVKQMNSLLESQQEGYIDICKFLPKKRMFIQKEKKQYKVQQMTDTEKEELDQEVNLSISKIKKEITNLHEEVESKSEQNGTLRQYQDLYSHLRGVVDYLEASLESVKDKHHQLRRFRIRQALEEADGYSRFPVRFDEVASSRNKELFTDNSYSPLTSSNNNSNNSNNIKKFAPKFMITKEKLAQSFDKWEEDERDEKEQQQTRPEKQAEVEWTQEEQQQFEEENTQLISSLETMEDKVKDLVRSITHISRLTDFVRLKVHEQDEQIDQVVNLVEEAVGNVQQGNEEMREASRSSRDSRMLILVFIIICALSLLFLHWYE